MGYATVRHVPRVFDYQSALKIHNNSTPIRGRNPELRPFGRRKDADTYSIRKNGEAIELVLYKTPVITFEAEGDVVLFTNGYDTVSTHQFLHQVLNIGANGARNTTVLTIDGQRYTLANHDTLRLRREDGKWTVLNAKTQWGWRLDRKAVTNVRTKYGDFYKYLKGFVNLRTEPRNAHRWTTHTVDSVVIPREELQSAFGQGSLASIREYAYMDKRGKQTMQWRNVTPEQYQASAKAFEYLIRPDQPEEGRHTNFYKAAMLLVAKCDSETMDIRADSVSTRSKDIVPLLDEVLFMLYANDVLVRHELALGKVSSGIYEHWMSEWEDKA